MACKKTLLIILILGFIGTAIAQNTGLTFYDSNLELNENNITGVNELKGFFGSACGSGQVVERIYSNGSYSCVDPVEDTGVENLSETLEAGNVANQTIRFGVGKYKGIQLGGATTNTNNNTDIAIGRGAQADAPENSGYGNETAVGTEAAATGLDATALGYQAEASGQGAVALGYYANAPNSYEATFGNLNGQELDVNATGNLTVHGEDLDLKSGDIENFFDQSKCGDSEAIKTVYPNGSYECNTISSDQTTENLTETLNAGNEASRDIDLKGNNLTSSDGEVCAGDLC